MGTMKQVLSGWFDEGVEQGATHMIVVCDTFDYGDFPIYVKPDEDARKETTKQGNESMQRILEVYDLRADKAAQMAEDRAFNFGEKLEVFHKFDESVSRFGLPTVQGHIVPRGTAVLLTKQERSKDNGLWYVSAEDWSREPLPELLGQEPTKEPAS